MTDISLKALANPELKVTIRGKEYSVAPIDGFAKQLTDRATPETAYDIMCRVAARCLGIPFSEVFGTDEQIGFSPADVMKVVDVATKQVTAVEATAPNGSSAGDERSGVTPLRSPESRPQTLQAS